jgi:hypothetical protein
MDEKLLHYLWRNKILGPMPLLTSCGKPVNVIYQGEDNYDSGPDFFNAKIAIGDTVWAGNVEIHIKSSDWFAHGHHRDSAYNNVALHVVACHNKQAVSSSGTQIPTLVIPVPENIAESYADFLAAGEFLPCQWEIGRISRFELRFWLEKLLCERLEQRHRYLCHLLSAARNDWETCFYYMAAQAFGGSANKEAFLLMAKHLPLKVLSRIKTSVIQLEAAMFGSAGMLENPQEAYHKELAEIYSFQKRKFSISPMPAGAWKFSRMRPMSSPYVRIALFAGLVHKSSRLFTKLLACNCANEAASLFSCSASGYWDSRYNFTAQSQYAPKIYSLSSQQGMVINAAVPILFGYGFFTGNAAMQENAIDMLRDIPAENIAAVTKWAAFGLKAENAADSQAILQMTQKYCKPKNCLSCCIGNKLIRHRAGRLEKMAEK